MYRGFGGWFKRLALLAAVASGVQAATAGDWPAFLGPTGDSKSPERLDPRVWTTPGGPPLAWWREVGDGYSAPAVAAGRLFHFDRHGDRARLTCLDAASGEELWRAEYPTAYEDYYGYSNGPRASPVVDGDRVYVFGVEGRLRCHRVSDGELLWEVDTTAEFGVVQNFFGVGSTPVVEGDLLIAMVGGSPPGSPGIHSGEVEGNGSGLVAFDKRSGEVRYRLSDELASYATPRLVTIGGRRLGFAFTRGGLLAFDPRAGRSEFFFPWRARILESVNASTPVVVGDTVFISETYGPGSALLRVAPRAGDEGADGPGYEVVWQDPPGRGKSLRTHWNTAIHHQGFLYASSGRSTGDAELRCVEHATGEVRWREKGLNRASLLYADGHFLVLGEYGTLRLVAADPERYREIAAVDYSAVMVPEPGGAGERPLLVFPAWNAPVLANGRLYLTGKDTLVALDLRAAPAETDQLPRPGSPS